MDQRTAIRFINRRGILLVFPDSNRSEPKSLWSEFFPKKKMKWEWDETGDDNVADLWHLMKRLSDCRKVVYSKWYKGRATFFSVDLFAAMLRLSFESPVVLSVPAREILGVLEESSPLSTKELKKSTELQGRDNEPIYSKALKYLFSRFLIVAYGEVDDGAFPSLAVGATRLVYEDLWLKSEVMSLNEAQYAVDTFLPVGSAFRKYFDKTVHVEKNLVKEL